ncbi:MAG TPA: DUF3455 domain-containing protein [Chitinophagaceae bacterium]|nr:DUF3455 domain-containing protein [Chitinophagaceae bacterium]
MKKQNIIKMRSFLTMIFFAAIITSCKKDKVDTNPTAHKINQSENLVIPGVIDLPSNLPAGNSRVATYYAEGVQKYKSQAKAGSPGVFEWVFVAPLADLYDVTGKKIGTHAAGPHWTLSPADSIFAQHFSPAKTAPSPDINSVDWLLLMPKSGKIPTGFFKDVAYIQRIATSGGKAPATAPMSESATVEVPYTAIYRFTKKN